MSKIYQYLAKHTIIISVATRAVSVLSACYFIFVCKMNTGCPLVCFSVCLMRKTVDNFILETVKGWPS